MAEESGRRGEHVPCFSFGVKGGDVAGERLIYDGRRPIARFEHRPIPQPEQEMRYFNGVPRPINLCDLVLRPGGRPLFAGVQLYWNLQTRVLATTELIGVEAAGQQSDRLELTFLSRDPGGVATSRRVLVVTYDPQLDSNVYEFAGHLELHSPECFDAAEQVSFEYCDPWYCDVPAPLIEFPGMWPKRAYSHLLAEQPDGTVKKMPLNHLGMRAIGQATVRPDGMFVLACEPHGNPSLQIVGDTAERTTIGVCHWGYDVHLGLKLDRDQLRQPICPRFRILNCPDDRARRLLAEAEPVPEIELAGMTELPIYQRKTSFEKGAALNQVPDSENTDPCFWMPLIADAKQSSPVVRCGSADRAEPDDRIWSWERNFGRSDDNSLKIAKKSEGPAEWYMAYDNQGGFGEPWTDFVQVRVTGYIKTRELTGPGACIALRYGVYNAAERYPYVCSRRVAGTTDWTRVSVELRGRRPDDSNAVYIILRQDGPGASWFDDLEIEFR